MKYTTINRIFTKLNRDFGITNLDESVVVEWTAEALSAINAMPYYENVVKFFNVKNYQVDLPNDYVNIVQIAKCTTCDDLDCLCPQNIFENLDNNLPIEHKSYDKSCEIEKEKNNCEDIIFIPPNLDLWFSTNFYKQNFEVVRLTTNSFFNSSHCKNNPYSSCVNEYNIFNNVIRFSFKEGVIALSYIRIPLDEQGYPLIPDTYAYTTAIEKYILYKLSERDFYKGVNGSVQRMQKFEKDWNKYCSQASSEMMIPNTIDKMQNIAEMWLKPIQSARSYYSFSSNLAREQKLKH